MAAILAGVVPLVLAGLKEYGPIVLRKIKSLIDQAVAKFQAAYPGKTIWQVFGASIATLWRDNHIDEKIYNALHLGSFVAKISSFSKKLIAFATLDPKLITPPDVVAHWDTAKLIDLLAGDGGQTDPAVVRKNMLKFEPVGTMIGMLQKNKFTLPGESGLKSHIVTVFNRFNKHNEPQKPEPLPVALGSGTTAPESKLPNGVSSIPIGKSAASNAQTSSSTPVPAPASSPNPAPTSTPAANTPVPHQSPLSQTTQDRTTADKHAADTSTTTSTGANALTALPSGSSTSASPTDTISLAVLPPDTPLLPPPKSAPSLTPQWLAAHPDALEDVPEQDRPAVLQTISSMLRIQAISPTTTAMQELMKMGAPSSRAIIRNPKAAWVSANKKTMGVKNAQMVFNNAQDQVIRLENMGIGLLEYVKGSGLARNDDGTSPSDRKLQVQEYLSKRGYHNLSIETLFGNVDDATAPESRTVYSPAAYFVELLGYLRNNNMDPASIVPDSSSRGNADAIDGTVLQSLFRRRPDLGNLQLTEENSETILPYIDLVNEVMESFIVNMTDYLSDSNIPKQAEIDVHNVTTQDSEELLSQPQNVSMAAYRHLAAAAYPTTLPYHQPLDTQRTFLNYLALPRAELVDAFRPKPPALSPAAKAIALAKSTSDTVQTLSDLQREVLDRQVDCERLGLIQEEYLILTKNVFWPAEFFSLTEGIDVSPEAYSKRIGLRSTAELWGYSSEHDMLQTDQSKQDGLQFVKKQLLPRSGITYTDLIAIVQTSFVNPSFPSGRDKTILDSLQFSYSFLSTLVDEGSTAESRYGKLAEFLARSHKVLDLATALSDTITAKRTQDITRKHDPMHIKTNEIKLWVLSTFARMGQVIVLDTSEGPQLEVTGILYASKTDGIDSESPIMPSNTLGTLSSAGEIRDTSGNLYKAGPIGMILPDGTIRDGNQNILGHVDIAGKVLYGNPIDRTDINAKFANLSFTLAVSGAASNPWTIVDGYLRQLSPSHIVEWTMSPNLGGSASLDDVRLIHLNGDSLTMAEWDRLHRFIRVWRKLGWSITETDRALTGINACLSAPNTSTPSVHPQQNGTNEITDLDELITFDNFSDGPSLLNDTGDNSGIPNSARSASPLPDITCEVIKELAAVSQLFKTTGLPLEQLLTLWTNLPSQGSGSLFYRLFFTRRTGPIDAAFAPDANGDFFTGNVAKISDHRTAVMAAFRLQSKELDILLGLTKPGVSPVLVPDILNLDNLSAIYRAGLFVRILGVGIADICQIAAAFVDPPPEGSGCLATLISQPTKVLSIVQTWAKINDASFTWAELRYILDSVPSPLDPLAPTEIDALRLSKTLHDGIIEIQTANPFVWDEANATDDMIQSKATLVFDTDTVASILALIHGTTVYTASAPVIQDKNFPAQVANLIPGAKYTLNSKPDEDSARTQTARLQITGILSSAQERSLLDLIKPFCPPSSIANGLDPKVKVNSSDEDNLQTDWEDCISRISSQYRNFYYDVLVDIFPSDLQHDPSQMILFASDLNEAQADELRQYEKDVQNYNAELNSLRASNRKQLLQDIADGMLDDESADSDGKSLAHGFPAQSQPLPTAPVPPSFEGQTSQAKALYFLQYFIPFLQARLARVFIIDTVADAAGFDEHALAKTFLERIIVMGKLQKPAIEYLLNSFGTSMSVYQGYLTPPASGMYAFYLPDSPQPNPITLEDSQLSFEQTKVRNKIYWVTRATNLTLGQVYGISMDSTTRQKLQWKQDSNAIASVKDTAFRAWRGFLNPPTLDSYVISVNSGSEPPPITLDNTTLSFSLQQKDPDTIYATASNKLQLDPARLYSLVLIGLLPSDLYWKSSSSTRSAISASSCLPDYSRSQALKLFDTMKKMALVVSHFQLSSDEITYIHSRSESNDFDHSDFNSLKNIVQWTRIYDYLALRNSLPAKTKQSLIDLFSWSKDHLNNADAQSDLTKQISLATSWPELQIQQILSHANFTTGQPVQFVNEIRLLHLQKLIGYANQLGVEIPRIFEWTTPLGTNTRDFFRYANIAQDIQKMVRSKFDLDTWTVTARPLNDTLRENQKNALIAYLLVQQALTVPNNITTADGLFEYFLIDVQMTPLVQTSRLKQAISTVQLFVQRCMLGLEESRGVKASALDRGRWQWMQKYRVWEGNRKIFLYPENWIDPSLRDDKSELFLQLEAELLQKDLTPDSVNTALKTYLYSVKQIANLQCIGLYLDNQDSKKVHVFARTRAMPYSYYYNWYLPNGDDGFWNGWQRMEVDIPHYVVPQTGLVGNYVAPVVFNGSLVLFIAQIMPYTGASAAVNSSTKLQDMASATVAKSTPQTSWQVQMSWTEYRNSRWTPRQICPSMFTMFPIVTQADIDAANSAKSTLDSAQQAYDAAKAVLDKTDTQIASDTDTLKQFQATPGGDAFRIGSVVAELNFLGLARSMQVTAVNVASVSLEAAKDAYKPLAFAYGGVADVVAIDEFNIVPSIVQQPHSLQSDLANSVKVYLTWAGSPQSHAAWSYNGTQLSMLDSSSNMTLFLPQPYAKSFRYKPATGSNLSAMYLCQAFEPQDATPSSLTVGVVQDYPSVENAETYPYKPLLSLQYNVDNSVNNSITASTVNTTGPSILMYNKQGIAAQPFYHSIINQLLQGTGGSDPAGIFKALANLPNSDAIGQVFGGSYTTASDGQPSMAFNERRTAYTLYNWELGLHAPMIIIDRLLKAAQYEQALQVCQYIFNPLNTGNSTDTTRFWVFPPFKFVRTQTIEEYFLSFQPGKPNADVLNWRNKPFAPHVVARSRPQAYMKWVVAKYIEILITWGDDLLRQNSLESIPLAIQCYVYASNIYGPRGQQYPRQPVKPETYNSLMTKLDAFDNAIVRLEEAFPFSNQTPLPVAKLPNDQSAQMANVFGSAGTLYFAIPDNPELRALASTIDDRLFKIRHSQDINGVFRQLPLQDPPIDPGLLVLAAAQGLNLSSVLADLNGPLPNCRFMYLLDRAIELTQEVKSLGSALLSIKEKRDGELLGNLRSKHELATNTSMLDLKKLALDDANASLGLLQYQRAAAVERLTYFFKLIGNDLSGIPQIDDDYIALIAKIDTPITDGGLAISPAEQLEMQKLQSATDLNTAVGALRTVAGILSALPNVDEEVEPLGVGVEVKFGPENFAKLTDSIAASLSIGVDRLNFEAGNASRLNQYQRAVQDRILNANNAGSEISSIDKQITAAKIRIDMAAREISLQQQQIDQAQEVRDFLLSKYTNVELYSWMDGQTKTLFYQTYSAAFALAMKAQKAFLFERPQKASAPFIKPGYWDASRDGLLSGETLFVALKQLQAAYMEERGYDYEISKSVSLRRLDPLALIALRETGSCHFTLPEVIYDMDFPGHYMRRIKSVAITIPCLVGPFTSINATLRLQSSKYRINAMNGDTANKYREDQTPGADPDPRFSTSTVSIPAIAASSGVDDAGVFELHFDDNATRFLPFEGAGAISTWTLDLPQVPDFRQYDYDSITDVILRIKYTSIEGGVPLRKGASENVGVVIKSAEYSLTDSGLVTLFDIKNDFASSWYRLTQAYGNPQHTATDLSVQLNALNERLPIFTAGRKPEQITPVTAWILTDKEAPGGKLALSSAASTGTGSSSSGPVSSVALPGFGQLRCYPIDLTKTPINTFSNWTLSFNEGTFELGKCLMVVSYKLKSTSN